MNRFSETAAQEITGGASADQCGLSSFAAVKHPDSCSKLRNHCLKLA